MQLVGGVLALTSNATFRLFRVGETLEETLAQIVIAAVLLAGAVLWMRTKTKRTMGEGRSISSS